MLSLTSFLHNFRFVLFLLIRLLQICRHSMRIYQKRLANVYYVLARFSKLCSKISKVSPCFRTGVIFWQFFQGDNLVRIRRVVFKSNSTKTSILCNCLKILEVKESLGSGLI